MVCEDCLVSARVQHAKFILGISSASAQNPAAADKSFNRKPKGSFPGELQEHDERRWETGFTHWQASSREGL